MFGFSLSELVVVIVVAVVVIGPKDMPKMLRKLGQMAGKLRRMASDLRAQSGIDEALRTEGLSEDIAEIRKLARGELDAVRHAASVDIASPAAAVAAASSSSSAYDADFMVFREREYPRDGADAANALPDNAVVYAEGMLRSAWARDPLYMLGDPDGVVPEEPPSPPMPDFSPEDEPPSPHLEAHGDALGAGDLAFRDASYDHDGANGEAAVRGPSSDDEGARR